MQGLLVATVVIMILFVLARSLTGKLATNRRASFDNTMLISYYVVAQGLAGLAVRHLFPLAAG